MYPASGTISRSSLALVAGALASMYSHAELDYLFMLFDITERAPAGASKLKRATAAMSAATTDPADAQKLAALARHVVDTHRSGTPGEPQTRSGSLQQLVTSLEKDGVIAGGPQTDAMPAAEGPVTQPEDATVAEDVEHASGRRPAESGSAEPTYEHDFFISHAYEDKDSFARPLAEELTAQGFRVWYDEFSLEIGDSLRESIDFGLSSSRYGVVVLSKAFFKKEWPRKELNGLTALERGGRKVILPVWHGVTELEVRSFSPTLADRVAEKSATGPKEVARVLARILFGRIQSPTGAQPPSQAHEHTDPGPAFLSHLYSPNGKAYAVAVLAAVPEKTVELSDDAQDLIADAFTALEPSATCERQTDGYTRWTRIDSRDLMAEWIGEVFKEQVVVLMRSMTMRDTEDGKVVVLSDMVDWWSDAIAAGERVLLALGAGTMVVGLAFNPYPSGEGAITALDPGCLPPAQRVASAHSIPPWVFQAAPAPAGHLADELTAAVASLLRAYSYRRFDATLSAIRAAQVQNAGTPVGEPVTENQPQSAPPEPQASISKVTPARDPIRLLRVIPDEVTAPRLDGTAGSALYRVPIQLSATPTAAWAELFVEAWNHPPHFTSMHRPGIASVAGDRIVLDGTTLEEIQRYHRDTLKLAVEVANRQAEASDEAERAAASRAEAQRWKHREDVRVAADEISFE